MPATYTLATLGLALLLALLPSLHAAQLSYLWPMPQSVNAGSTVVYINPSSFSFSLPLNLHPEAKSILEAAVHRYTKLIFFKAGTPSPPAADITSLSITLTNPGAAPVLDLDMDESYDLSVPVKGSAVLSASSVWGVLRGIETFSQTVLLSSQNHYNIKNAPLAIKDAPSFPWRGLLVDSSRHFLSLKALRRTIDAMAYNKMNVLHWHLVDAVAFPLVIPSRPLLAERGSWVPTARYSPADVASIVAYARERGVRVVPEIDIPGHTASWGKGYPVTTFCPKASATNPNIIPLNPALNLTFPVVQDVLTSVMGMFPDGFLHLGGDEVQVQCWAEDPSVQAFMQKQGWGTNWDKLWAYFQDNTQPFWQGRRTMVAWEELLLEQKEYKPPMDSVIEAWRFADSLYNITKQGYRGLLSYGNYLDQMEPANVYRYLWGDTWRTFYQNYPIDTSVGVWTSDMIKRVIGGEAAMWGEQVDDVVIDERVWPRTCAVAERLWSPSSVNSVSEALPRINEQRCRMVLRGIRAGPLSPNYCQYAYDD